MFFGIIILLIALAVVFLPTRVNINKSGSALEVLKERLAKGEISIEEYEQLKNIIK